MNALQIKRAETQRAELARRLPGERRAAWAAAMADDRRKAARRTADRNAAIANWTARFDAARNRESIK